MRKIFLALSAALIFIPVVSMTFFDIGAFGQEKKLPIYSVETVGMEEKKWQFLLMPPGVMITLCRF